MLHMIPKEQLYNKLVEMESYRMNELIKQVAEIQNKNSAYEYINLCSRLNTVTLLKHIVFDFPEISCISYPMLSDMMIRIDKYFRDNCENAERARKDVLDIIASYIGKDEEK